MEILDVKIQYSLILMSFISKSEPMSPSHADTKQKFLFVCSFFFFPVIIFVNAAVKLAYFSKYGH